VKAPRTIWVWGVRYETGDTIPPDQARTARMLIELADKYTAGVHSDPHEFLSRGVAHRGE
jgi:hypothetical protein